MSEFDLENGRNLSKAEVVQYAITYRVLADKTKSLQKDSLGKELLIQASQVLFDGISQESVSSVIIKADSLKGKTFLPPAKR